MMTLQPTAQYGQMLWVCVVREIFSSRSAARAGLRSNPNAVVVSAAPVFRKPRLVKSIGMAVKEESPLLV
jgi:hypothetical protein